MPEKINGRWVFTDEEIEQEIARGKAQYVSEDEAVLCKPEQVTLKRAGRAAGRTGGVRKVKRLC